MDIRQLAPDEPLSPSSCSSSRRSYAPRLSPASAPRSGRRHGRRAVEAPAPAVAAPLAPSLGAMLVARIGQLALIFVAVTILILAMSLVANAMR